MKLQLALLLTFVGGAISSWMCIVTSRRVLHSKRMSIIEKGIGIIRWKYY